MKSISKSMLALLASAAFTVPAIAQETAPAEGTAETAPAVADYDVSSVVATVNGQDITLGELAVVFDTLPDQYRSLPGDVLFPALLDQVIGQVLLADEGEKEGLADSPVVKLALENARRDEVASALIRQLIATEVTDEAVQEAYDAQVAEMPAEVEINASHILLETEEDAKAVQQELADGADFAELAKERSTGPSGPNGGELGWFTQGQMVAPFEEAAFALEPGQVSDPVQTQFGWHVIKLNDTREKPKPTLDEMRPQIVNQLSEAAVSARLEELRSAAEIEQPETGIPGDALKDPALLGN